MYARPYNFEYIFVLYIKSNGFYYVVTFYKETAARKILKIVRSSFKDVQLGLCVKILCSACVLRFQKHVAKRSKFCCGRSPLDDLLTIVLKVHSEKAVLISTCVAFVANTLPKITKFQRGWRNPATPFGQKTQGTKSFYYFSSSESLRCAGQKYSTAHVSSRISMAIVQRMVQWGLYLVNMLDLKKN